MIVNDLVVLIVLIEFTRIIIYVKYVQVYKNEMVSTCSWVQSLSFQK